MADDIGSTVSFSATAASTVDATGFNALSPTQVGSVASISPRADVHTRVNRPADLETGRAVDFKGGVKQQEITVVLHTEDFADTGQDAIRTAAANRTVGALLITNASGDEEWYNGLVSDYTKMEKSESSFEGCSFVFLPHTASVVIEA